MDENTGQYERLGGERDNIEKLVSVVSYGLRTCVTVVTFWAGLFADTD